MILIKTADFCNDMHEYEWLFILNFVFLYLSFNIQWFAEILLDKQEQAGEKGQWNLRQGVTFFFIHIFQYFIRIILVMALNLIIYTWSHQSLVCFVVILSGVNLHYATK